MQYLSYTQHVRIHSMYTYTVCTHACTHTHTHIHAWDGQRCQVGHRITTGPNKDVHVFVCVQEREREMLALDYGISGL